MDVLRQWFRQGRAMVPDFRSFRCNVGHAIVTTWLTALSFMAPVAAMEPLSPWRASATA
jgi:hypothetical protein